MKVAVVDPEQVISDLGDALVLLASQPDLRKRMAIAGRELVRQEFAWRRRVDAMQEIYRQCM
jgi:glycosyltransferase involved in cell wall biosynthesis